MDERPPGKQDPLAIAVIGCAALLAVGLVLYLVLGSPPAPPGPPQGPRLIEELRSRLEPAPPKQEIRGPKGPAQASPKSGGQATLAAGRSWHYAVAVEPPVWREITLSYRTQREGAGIGVLADFVHAGGKMNFHLGTFAADHPSHANTRFPGFFMYASYFPPALEKGQRLSWGWPWQPAKPGRMKRYEGTVLRLENVQVPAGTFEAAVIEAELSYIDEGKVRAKAKETLWFAPRVSQVVKIVREGRVPDEGVGRIVAELAEYR